MENTDLTENLKDKPKIAFIDDEKRILRSMKLIFRKSHDVFITTDPKEYIQYIRDNHVHVAISDQRMPERLGVDILRDIKEISPHTMRILLTGYADLNAIIGSINEGEIYRYLTKPCKSEDLQQVIGRATQLALKEKDSLSSASNVDTSDDKQNLLIIDESVETVDKIRSQFKSVYNIFYAGDLETAYDCIANNDIGVCVTDIHINGENIAPIIYTLKQDAPHLVVLVQTQFQDASLLIDLINKGQVYRCLPKPMRASLLEISINRAFRCHLKLKQSETFVQRFEVEKDSSEEQINNSSNKVKGFIGRLRKRFSRQRKNRK